MALCALCAALAVAWGAPPHPPPPATPAFVGLIDPNAADAATLERLPGIGPVLAARIVAERQAGGPYAGWSDLRRVRGIGPVLARKLRPWLTFGERSGGLIDVFSGRPQGEKSSIVSAKPS